MHKPNYLAVFAALAALTVVEVVVASTSIGNAVLVPLLLAMALAKASLVALYYMHLKFEGPIIRVIAAVPLLLVLIVMLLPVFDLALAQ